MGLLLVITPDGDGEGGVELVVGEHRYIGEHQGGGSWLIDYDDQVLEDEDVTRIVAFDETVELEDFRLDDVVSHGLRAFDSDRGPIQVLPAPFTSRPPAVAYPGRVWLSDLANLERPTLGTYPGSQQPMTTNAIGERRRVSYLSPDTSLVPTSQHAIEGYVYELETTWEPLGWALDEWISTLTLAPGVDVVESALDIQSNALLSGLDRHSETDDYEGGAVTTSATNENSASSGRQRGSSTGFTAGLGHQTSAGLSLNWNPVAALAQSITGAVQLGFSTVHQAGQVAASAEINRQISDSIQQTARQARQQQVEALAQSRNGYEDSRTLRAYANGFAGATQNLALFSVVRQWLVTSTQARRRHVVFAPAHDVDKDFTAEDVFLYRDVLKEVVTDSTVAADIDTLASAYQGEAAQPDGNGWGTETKVLSVTATGRIRDRGKGFGSKIRIGFRFAGDTTPVRAEPTDGDADNIDRYVPFDEKTLDGLRSWYIEFDNPGRVHDRECVVDDVVLKFELQDGKRTAQEEVLLGRLVLSANTPKQFVRSNLLPVSGDDASTRDLGRRARRLLAHLNAFKHRYRLAIDLVADPATRLARLDPAISSQIADPNPVGVAGVHLAFLTTKGDAPANDEGLDQQLVATPAGGTYLEQWPGQNRDGASPEAPRTVVLKKDSTLTWPDASALEYLTRGTLPASASKGAPDAPRTPEATLTTSLADVVTAAASLKDALDTAREKLKDTVPTLPEGQAPKTGGAQEGEGGDKPGGETKEGDAQRGGDSVGTSQPNTPES